MDMLSEFQPQQPTDLFVPSTSNAPLDFVTDLFPLSPVPADQQALAGLPASPPAQQALSSSSSGSPAKERKSSRERQSSGRWSTRDKGPVSDARKLEVNREAQRRFRQRQKVQLLHTNGFCYMQQSSPANSRWVPAQARSRSIETQLAEATAALREMRAKHSQLEARNQLLEKVALLNKTQTSSDQTLLWQASLPHLVTIQKVKFASCITRALCTCQFLDCLQI